LTWRGALATAVVIVTAWPATAAAQATPLPAPLELRQQEVSREERARRAVVRPPIKMDEAVRQAERDAAEVEQAQRTERLVREAVRPEPRRPDLQHDVVQGIQQRALQRALRR